MLAVLNLLSSLLLSFLILLLVFIVALRLLLLELDAVVCTLWLYVHRLFLSKLTFVFVYFTIIMGAIEFSTNWHHSCEPKLLNLEQFLLLSYAPHTKLSGCACDKRVRFDHLHHYYFGGMHDRLRFRVIPTILYTFYLLKLSCSRREKNVLS